MASSPVAEHIAEFVGTFLLVFTVGCNVLAGNMWAGVSIGSVLMVCIYAMGGISGANFNPAVSLALALSKRGGGPGLEARTALSYAGVQLCAGACAAVTYSLLFWETFNLSPMPGFSWYNAAMAEVLYTCMLCFTVLNVAAASKATPNDYFGLAIGLVVVAGAYAGGPVSGGCFNPAVAFGIDVSSLGLGFGWCLAYMLFQALGSVIAVALFRAVRPEEFEGGAPSQSSALVGEFVGTFFLVVTVGLNVLAKSPAGALSIASSLVSMIYALGGVSGAHFNPAVTLAIFASGRSRELTPQRMGQYIGAQVLGACAAGFAYAGIRNGQTFPLAPGDKYGVMQALVAEAAFTFVLCYVVLSVAVSKSTKSTTMYGLAIGTCVTVGGNAIGAVSGGALNPAVALGVALPHVFAGGSLAKALFWTAAELVGGAAAAVAFEVTHAVDKAKDVDAAAKDVDEDPASAAA